MSNGRKEIRSQRRPRALGTLAGRCRLGVGALGYLLRNRRYVGEVVHRGQVHSGAHEAILDRGLFEEVQTRLGENGVQRKAKLRASSAILMGYLFEAAGNRMTPSHSTKGGRRHRYYVSQALLQRRPELAGPIARVSPPELEALVMQGLRSHLVGAATQHDMECDDRSLIEEYISRVIVHADAIEIVLKARPDETESASDQDAGLMEEGAAAVQSIKLPWVKKCAVAKKGISCEPVGAAAMNPETQKAILNAIAKARNWMDCLVSGRASSTEEIARHEKITERYLRQLMLFAFASPQFVRAIAHGEGSEHLTLTELAAAFPVSWSAQSRLLQS